MLARLALCRLKDQRRASDMFTVLIYVSTALQWLIIIIIDQLHGYAPISDTPLILLLFVMQIILQGTVFGYTVSYRFSRTLTVYPLFVPIVGAHLYLHDPPPGRSLLMTKLEFLGVFVFILTMCCVVSLVNVHTRRIHLAELAGLAEHYQRQRDRLHYDVVYSQGSAHAGARRDGSARAPESVDGLLAHAHPPPEVASTYGSTSELNFSELDDTCRSEQSLTELSNVNGRLTVLDFSANMPSEAAQKREAALWSTLESMGMTPKEHAHTD